MENKDNLTVWKSMRISFWLLCLFFIINIFIVDINEIGYTIFAFLFVADIIWCFVTSILHLKRYKEKGFAITSLVISSMMVSIILLGMFIGLFFIMLESW